MWPNPQESADLVKFTEKVLNRKLHFFVCRNFVNFRKLINFEINHSFLIKPFPNITKLVRAKIFKHFLSESTQIPRNLHVDFSKRILIPKIENPDS